MAAELTTDELKVLDLLLAGDHPILRILREQLRRCSVRKREITGAGFYLDLDFPDDVPRLPVKSRITIFDVAGRVSGVEVGFVLFVHDGRIDYLECFTWDDGEVSKEWKLEEVHYLRRDPPGSAGLIETSVRDEAALAKDLLPIPWYKKLIKKCSNLFRRSFIVPL